MKKLTILGAGCTKCNQLAEATRTAADACGIDYEIEKVTDFLKFADYGVMITPALVIDGEVKVSGKVPSVADLQNLIGKEAS
ncbi:thioredoxin family protein [Haloferula sp. A504]|uniref:thioredoxin family protein n=1 Tax=Haloferula sp. A504 TaxID=3373601 RepID=UPI0031C4A232|nr:thioredoxin family protein [Verrucomicrobiaceae bacterium E54]